MAYNNNDDNGLLRDIIAALRFDVCVVLLVLVALLLSDNDDDGCGDDIFISFLLEAVLSVVIS